MAQTKTIANEAALVRGGAVIEEGLVVIELLIAEAAGRVGLHAVGGVALLEVLGELRAGVEALVREELLPVVEAELARRDGKGKEIEEGKGGPEYKLVLR